MRTRPTLTPAGVEPGDQDATHPVFMDGLRPPSVGMAERLSDSPFPDAAAHRGGMQVRTPPIRCTSCAVTFLAWAPLPESMPAAGWVCHQCISALLDGGGTRVGDAT